MTLKEICEWLDKQGIQGFVEALRVLTGSERELFLEFANKVKTLPDHQSLMEKHRLYW